MKSALKEIIGIVGENNVLLESPELERYSVEGKRPNIVVLPRTIEEISEIVRLASVESLTIIPWGGGTKIGLGKEPCSIDVVLSTRRINRVIEHESSDLVAITECGIPLKEFQRILRDKNQFVAIDPPHLDSGATVGGIIATNDSGPRRLRYGTIREFLIGIKVVRSDGSIVKGGAKVVKNVAGYDLPKLYVGSLGTLGIIVEATFRLYPVPEFSQTFMASFSTLEELQQAVNSVLNSSLVPTCLETLNPNLADAISGKLNLNLSMGRYALALRMESVEKAVREQIAKVKDICEEKGGNGILVDSKTEKDLWQEIREFPWSMTTVGSRAVCKASVLINDVPRVFRELEELSRNSGLRALASARAGNGVIISSLEGEVPALVEAVSSLRHLAISLDGTLVVQDAPHDLKSQVDVWGELGKPLRLMERLKSLFDPNSIFNPGRFVGGI
jgi:glycolate oxidase FAD binding subunit